MRLVGRFKAVIWKLHTGIRAVDAVELNSTEMLDARTARVGRGRGSGATSAFNAHNILHAVLKLSC